MEKYILSVLVRNQSGVLARVASLFGRRGYNIDSLTVSATTNPSVSRMSILVTGDEVILEQVMKQVSKLHEVIWVRHLMEQSCLCRELVFIRLVAADAVARDAVRQLCELYNAEVVETTETDMIVTLTDIPSRITAFLDVISSFEIKEMCRSGITAITK